MNESWNQAHFYDAKNVWSDVQASLKIYDRWQGATTPIKNQRNCGSCWTFSATEELESAIFMNTGILTTLVWLRRR